MAASSIEDLRSKLKGLADLLGGTGNEPGLAVAVSVSPRSKPRPVTAAAALPAARHPPPPPRQFQPTVRPGSSVLQAANAHARDAPIGGLLAKYKDAEQTWLKVRAAARLDADGVREAKGQGCSPVAVPPPSAQRHCTATGEGPAADGGQGGAAAARQGGGRAAAGAGACRGAQDHTCAHGQPGVP